MQAAEKTKSIADKDLKASHFLRTAKNFELHATGMSEPLAACFKLLERAADSAPKRALLRFFWDAVVCWS